MYFEAWVSIHSFGTKSNSKGGGSKGWKGLVKVKMKLCLSPKPLWVQMNCFTGGNKRYVIPHLIKSNSENTKSSFQASVIWCLLHTGLSPGQRPKKCIALWSVGCVATCPFVGLWLNLLDMVHFHLSSGGRGLCRGERVSRVLDVHWGQGKSGSASP